MSVNCNNCFIDLFIDYFLRCSIDFSGFQVVSKQKNLLKIFLKTF